MHHFRGWLLAAALLCGIGTAAAADFSMSVHVGFGGAYRLRTLVPVMVDIINAGPNIQGELQISTDPPEGFTNHYRKPVTIPTGFKGRYYLTMEPSAPFATLTVRLMRGNQTLFTAVDNRAQQLTDYERLAVLVSGVNSGPIPGMQTSQALAVPDTPVARPWDFTGATNQQRYGKYYGGMPSGSAPAGILKVVLLDPAGLPDNPECFGSVSTLFLMSDITANSLSRDVQEALSLWSCNGGHLVVAGGGVKSRFNDPFFTRLLPQAGAPNARVDRCPDGEATTVACGSGWVTRLSFDPAATSGDVKALSALYNKILSREPRVPAAIGMLDGLNQAVAVRNLKPPDLKLIIFFLITYLIVLVPINYFVLKRMDKRELAWLTTPAIVLVFTVGAYGIGYATKGHRLVLNAVTVVEAMANQPSAEAVSQTLIFSPSRTHYQMDLGELANALMVSEVNLTPEYDYTRRSDRNQMAPLRLSEEHGHRLVKDVMVNMWAIRQFATVHRIDMGQGIAAKITPGKPASTPRATGSLTNHTPYTFELAELYQDGALVGGFRLQQGETVTLAKLGTTPPLKLNEDESAMLEKLQAQSRQLFTTGNAASKGSVLVGFTRSATLPLRVSNQAPTAAMTMMVVHLGGEAVGPTLADGKPIAKPPTGGLRRRGSEDIE
jgi:hypothetical protein